MSEKKTATTTTVVAKKNKNLFRKLFFRRKIKLFDLDPAAFEKAVKVFHLHRMADADLHVFYRKSLSLFYDPISMYGYNILTGELD